MKALKQTKGRVGVQVKEGRLRLNLPREWFGGEQKRFALGIDATPSNLILAEQIARQVELDYLEDKFDPTLKRYKPQTKPAQIQIVKPISLGDLWDRYQSYKAPGLKETTIVKIETFTKHIAKISNLDPCDALTVRERLRDITTNHQVKRILNEIDAAFKFGIKYKLIQEASSPYSGMAAELPKFNYQVEPHPNAFSEKEMEEVIAAFQNHKGNWNGRGVTGSSYAFYAPFVQFLFLTGCRPSEAIGLRWKSISGSCDEIEFNGSLLYMGNRWIQTTGSKNNKKRTFPCSLKLQNLLLERKQDARSEALVFPSKKGKSINYTNFGNNAWKKVVSPIKEDTTAYSCRDTFITLQLLKGIPAFVVAYWVDSSVEIIERFYADTLKLRLIKPMD
jgi:integrase